ncbi:hypothetical protein Moror_75 [Moniliophthora roreri MCA 2997]|uniref:FAM192A/Fyv6 N-terminal domain-containing protein n=1 Tax=Moniliophthora roreri (strain MCA 2997) TaxID=1381753 RepID=V2Y0P0_MONRO|nr:hypothetical protein Moror_75 [Moniliophthora roreri MCA 2997]
MDGDPPIPSLSSGAVGSRFVSQDDIETARARREEQWKAAYARLGQEPPSQQQEDAYDGRSLAEKLAANRAAKQEEWEEKTKLANQFRALEEDEIMFLDSVREKQEEEERQRKERDGEEVKNFKEAVAARTQASNGPPPTTTSPPPPNSTSKAAPPAKAKKALKGVVIKKKTTIPKSGTTSDKGTKVAEKPAAETKADEKSPIDDTDEPTAKRRRISEKS